MALLLVGPSSAFLTIAQAMAVALPNDTVQLESGYSNETATVTQSGMTVNGGAGSTGIVLQLAVGVAVFTATGTAPIEILDASDGGGIVGNAGNNRITVSAGVDAVDGGLGVDRLVVDYRLATGAVTGDSTSNFTEAGGGGRTVTITDGTIEHFTVLTGAGADTLTTGSGDDIITAGNGANTITAGQGANVITGGNDADTITALDGGNFIDGGDGTNVITSGAGNDTILSGIGADTIVAGAGADVVTIRGGADTADAGAGTDRLIVDYAAMTTDVSGGITGGTLASGYVGHLADLVVSTVDFVGVENFTISTGSGNDLVVTGDGEDVLSGGAGADTLSAGGGDDRVTGGAGNDILQGGAGIDAVVYSGRVQDYTVTNNGDGTFTVVDGRAGSPEGTDTVSGFENLFFGLTTSTVTAVGASPANAVLGYGAAVSLILTLSAAVTVDTAGGVPMLLLGNGAAASYLSGSGTNTLVFGYTVSGGQDTADLTVAGSRLNGAVIADLDGNAADLGGAVANPAGILKVEAIAAFDVTTGQAVGVVGSVYSGPVANIEQQFIRITADNVNVTAATDNWFIRTGGGNDAIAVSSGTNVLDGGTGSNFLTGGSGADTFFVDTRGAAAETWNTIVNFQTGDTATIWGATPDVVVFTFVEGAGAAGFSGLTLHATAANMPTASMTFAGMSVADLTSGRLTQVSGFDPVSGSTYTSFQANA